MDNRNTTNSIISWVIGIPRIPRIPYFLTIALGPPPRWDFWFADWYRAKAVFKNRTKVGRHLGKWRNRFIKLSTCEHRKTVFQFRILLLISYSARLPPRRVICGVDRPPTMAMLSWELIGQADGDELIIRMVKVIYSSSTFRMTISGRIVFDQILFEGVRSLHEHTNEGVDYEKYLFETQLIDL